MTPFRLMAVLAVFGLSACGDAPEAEPTTTDASAGTEQVFTFTAIPDQDEARLVTRFSQVADYLEAKLGVPVQYIPVKSYAAAVTAFRNDEVQLAWFGGLSGVQARLQVPDSRAIAQGAEDPYFRTYFIAHKDSGLSASEEFPSDIAGRRFTFGSKGSTSGRLMPEFHIRQALGQTPEDVFERVGFSGDHSATIAMVESGAFEVGAVNYKVWEAELAAGDIDPELVSVIWKTPPYPDYHWVIRGDVDDRFGENFADLVQQTLVELEDRAILDAFPRSAFIPASNEDYQPILDTAREIGLID